MKPASKTSSSSKPVPKKRAGPSEKAKPKSSDSDELPLKYRLSNILADKENDDVFPETGRRESDEVNLGNMNLDDMDALLEKLDSQMSGLEGAFDGVKDLRDDIGFLKKVNAEDATSKTRARAIEALKEEESRRREEERNAREGNRRVGGGYMVDVERDIPASSGVLGVLKEGNVKEAWKN